MNKEYLVRTNEDVENFARNCFKEFEDKGITKVLAVSRGGLVPGIYVSYYFDVHMEITDYSSMLGIGWYPKQNIRFLNGVLPFTENDVVLIVDDDAGSGHTINDLKEFFERLKIKVYTATINERGDAIHKPDYSMFKIPQSAAMVYPWNIDYE